METYMLLLDVAILLSVGLALAMFGGGGAVILIPYLTQVAGYPLDEAVLLSLLTIGINTGIKTFKERSSIDWKAVLTFSLLSFPTAAISGSMLAPITPDSVRMTVFGAFTLTVATLMFFPINQAAFSRKNPIALSVSALLTGVICGLIGVGGGIFIAPTLSLFWATPIKKAVKGSLAIVALQSAAALVGYLGRGVSVSPTALLYILLLIAGGMMVGKKLKAATSDRNLKSGFAVFLVLIGIWVLLRA
jgi:uncharacterized membrane protein YfcA